MLEFQKNELEQAKLSPNEDVLLEEERSSLVNFERIYQALQDSYTALYGEQKGLEWLNQAQLALQESKAYDPFITEKAEELSNHYYALEEITYALRSQLEELQYNPERLNEIENAFK